MLYTSPDDWLSAEHKRVALFGMSGVGKTRISGLLRESGAWFHYSVDYRIGTRYMGERILDNVKREAMKTPFLRELLMSDSIYIASNITFANLSPLSTYLGKPGDHARGGLDFEVYLARQREHRAAEIAATKDVAAFAEKAGDIYGYPHFIADCSGSLCEVVNPEDPDDPVMQTLAATALPIWLEGTEDDVETLAERFDQDPKPMYYEEGFLLAIWGDYLAKTGASPSAVDPDHFIRWGFRRLLSRRLPIYAAIAARWGLTVPAAAMADIRTPHDFVTLVADRLEAR
ncbi:MAG: ATPase [Pseudomonadota bacterium]